MIYIALKDNKIVFVCESDSEKGVIASLQYEGITDYTEIKTIPNEYFQGKVGNDIREFDSNYEFLPLSQRKDYIDIPEGKKIEGDEFVDMTLKEKIDSGLIVLSDKEKYDEELKQIRPKTIDELLSDKIITSQEWYDYKLNECYALRKSAYMNESDGLFFDYQRGEVDKSIWENKVKEIKQKYPKPIKP